MGGEFEQPSASGWKALAEMVPATNDYCLGQKISAQSLLRFGTTTALPGPPCPRDTGLCSQVPLSDLQRLELEQIAAEPLRGPFGCLPRQYWPLGEAGPKLFGLLCRADRQLRILAFNLGAKGTTASAAPALRLVMGSTPHLAARGGKQIHHQIGFKHNSIPCG